MVDRRGTWTMWLIAALVIPITLPLFAQTPPAPAGSDEKAELNELEELLKQETELATRTRMNHDYVPGMVTVLQGDELEALGVRNVWEALSLIPGVQTVRDLYSSPLVLVRGINFIFNSGNIKVLVDSVPLNQEAAGINSSILLMPIEEVERIELMRGPGSAIHGDAAYLGLLNIVTRRNESAVYAAVSSEEVTGGAHVSWSDPRTSHRFSLGLSGFRNHDVDGAGPGEARDEKGFGRLAWGYGGLSLSVQALRAEHESPPQEGGERYEERRLAAELRYARDLSSSVHGEVYGGLLRNDDAVGGKRYDGETLQAGLDVSWHAPGKHTLLVTGTYARTRVFSGHLVLPPLFDLHVFDVHRSWASIGLQDQWDLTPRLTFTAGGRVDDFSDIGTKLTCRFALVYRLDDQQILKTQYAQGFRSPWFAELYSSGRAQPGIGTERIDTAELSYILRHSGFVGRVTAFRSELKDMIQPPLFPGGQWSNAAHATSTGVEVEWTQQISRSVKASANVSWVDPDDARFTGDVLAASEWLGNLSLLADPASWLRLGVRWNHVGTRGGSNGTSTIAGYDTVDLTATVPNLGPGFTVRGGVKDVLDDEVRYITTLPPPFQPILARYGGRSFWAEVSFRF